MAEFVTPKVYLVGFTNISPNGESGMWQYLEDTGNMEFVRSLEAARSEGLSDGEILCSFFAKLCYASLTLGKNDNVSRIRDIPANIENCLDVGHGSVFEHASINFVATNVSRVFTHELVRHRVGTAFSQTSGRYVRAKPLKFILPPELEPLRGQIETTLESIESNYQVLETLLGLNGREAFRQLQSTPRANPWAGMIEPTDEEIDKWFKKQFGRDKLEDITFAEKKRITSALRRILPNGMANEIGFTLNLRSLRHTVMMRTSRHAEWEIRFVFQQVYNLVKEKFPLIFCDAKEEVVDGILEVSGMKMNPYEAAGA